jgi:hypothetical protein
VPSVAIYIWRTQDPVISRAPKKLLLRAGNILEEVGENQPLVRAFLGLEPNAQGKLRLEFVPRTIAPP